MPKKKVVKETPPVATESEPHYVKVTFFDADKVKLDVSATGAEQIWALATIFENVREGLKSLNEDYPPGFKDVERGLFMLTSMIMLRQQQMGVSDTEAAA